MVSIGIISGNNCCRNGLVMGLTKSTIGLDDLEGLFQPNWLCDSVMRKTEACSHVLGSFHLPLPGVIVIVGCYQKENLCWLVKWGDVSGWWRQHWVGRRYPEVFLIVVIFEDWEFSTQAHFIGGCLLFPFTLVWRTSVRATCNPKSHPRFFLCYCWPLPRIHQKAASSHITAVSLQPPPLPHQCWNHLLAIVRLPQK